MRRMFIATLVIVITVAPYAATPRGVKEIGPDADWCAAANALGPGEELRLRPGEYRGPCTFRSGGRSDAPTVVSGVPNAERPRIVYESTTDNVVNVRAGFITLRRLHFGPTMSGVDAIRIHGGDGLTIEDCRFDDLGGAAVVTNRSISQLTIRANEIGRSRATAIYLGCHSGDCAVDAVVEGNHISEVTASPAEVGYGMQVKLNSVAVIRDNVVRLTKGPGIMVYGSRDLTRLSRIESNFTAGSSTSAGIVVGGGPVVVRNNIAVGSATGGIALEDYGGRGLLRGIVVTHNTVWGNLAGGLIIASSHAVDARLLHNAVHQPRGPALPDPRPGVISLGNVDCTATLCFKSAAQLDFTPAIGSLLEHRALRDRWSPELDYFGNARPQAAAVGAVEAPGGVVLADRRKTDSAAIRN
jgi:hypothetical protein